MAFKWYSNQESYVPYRKSFKIGFVRPVHGFWLVIQNRVVIAIDWTERLTIRFMLKTKVNL